MKIYNKHTLMFFVLVWSPDSGVIKNGISDYKKIGEIFKILLYFFSIFTEKY